MKVCSIIPARSGSKGIKNKNIKKLNGKPLMSYSILASLNAKKVNETYVSTDSDSYIEIAKKIGAKTIKRPQSMSLDNSKTEEAISHFLKKVDCDIVVLIQATSPLIKSKYLDESIDMLVNQNYDSIVSVYKDHGFWWDNNTPMYDPKNRPMRQEQKSLYKESGMFYIFKAESFLKEKCRISGKSGIYETPKIRSFLEIDESEDFKIMSEVMKILSD
jgi:CMP-N-acetylneuraminic acid synthetase